MGQDNRIRVGGIYACRSDDGTWRLTRVLAADKHSVHVRSYSDKFSQKPDAIDLSSLSYAIGHMPLAIPGFVSEPHELISIVPVDESELEGYRYYLQAMSGEVDD